MKTPGRVLESVEKLLNRCDEVTGAVLLCKLVIGFTFREKSQFFFMVITFSEKLSEVFLMWILNQIVVFNGMVGSLEVCHEVGE